MYCKSRIHPSCGNDVPSIRSSMSASGFRRLLVPLDGSPLAEHALPHALAIARRSGASIRLAHVHAPLDKMEEPWRLYSTHFSDLNEERVRQKQNYLNDVVRRIGRRDSVNMVTYVAESDRTAEQLCAVARGVDLVVMATHGRGRWGKLWHGSTSDAVLSRLACPLLLVRGYQSPVDLTGDPLVRKVLVPLDGSKDAEQVLKHAAAIGQVSNAAVTLLHVDRSGRANHRIAAEYVQDYLRHAAKTLGDRLATVSTRILQTDARTAQAVLSFATEHEVDLVAVTSHAGGRLAGFTQDRVADVILQRPGMKVLILRRDDGLKQGAMT